MNPRHAALRLRLRLLAAATVLSGFVAALALVADSRLWLIVGLAGVAVCWIAAAAEGLLAGKREDAELRRGPLGPGPFIEPMSPIQRYIAGGGDMSLPGVADLLAEAERGWNRNHGEDDDGWNPQDDGAGEHGR